jgi:anthranilate phosphoribosyltransferase
MSDVLTAALARLVRREELTDGEIDAALGYVLEGNASEVEIAALIVALRTKGETTAELAALVRTMLRYSVAIDVAPGAIDTCGTGGDRTGTVNISTLAALIAAGAGARVIKHGNRAQSSRCGSADVLEALGIPIELGPEVVSRCVAEAGIGFAFAPRYHPALRFLGPVRKAIGVQTTFNFLGPLANPARVTRQCVGVSDGTMAEQVLHVLVANGAERAFVFYGDDGLDELTTTTTSQVFEYIDGEVHKHTLDPTGVGIPFTTPESLLGGDAATNADVVKRVLDGESGPLRDIAVLNASVAISVAGIASNLPTALDAARESIDSGRARDVLDRWCKVAGDARAAEQATEQAGG